MHSQKKKILITGGSGFIGKHLTAELHKIKIPFLIASRSIQLDSPLNSYTVGNINGLTDWGPALSGISDVIHLAARVHITKESSTDAFAAFHAVNTEGTLNLARQAAAEGVKRFIYISSVKVNGEGRHTAYLESDTPSPEDNYAVSKCEAEHGLWVISADTGMEIVILRIPLVYGPGVGANFLNLLKAVDQGWPLPLGGINNRRSLLYVGNLISAILCILQSSKAANQLFLLSDSQDTSTSQLVKSLAHALSKQDRLFTLSEGLLRSIAGFIGKTSAVDRLYGSLYLDCSKIQKELDWRPPFTLQDGLKATANWYHSRV